MEKPKSVILAIRLIWISFLVLGPLKAVVDPESPLPHAAISSIVIMFLVAFGLIYLITTKILAGKNWARILYLVLTVLSIVTQLPSLPASFSASAITGLIVVVQLLAQAYASYLLFTKPGSAWFSKETPTVTPA